jgi:indole-3-glycerol phosphate synthase
MTTLKHITAMNQKTLKGVNMTILDQIVEQKKEMVAAARAKIPQSLLEKRLRNRLDHRPFFKRLQSPGPGGANIIAEIKRASPSKGPIRPDLNAADYARCYEKGGAACLSVLTDRNYFMGTEADLIQARIATTLPVLRKDFTVSSYQLYESAAMGADAVLLIVRILSRNQLQSYLALCDELRLDALVEVHSEKDVDDAIWADAKLIGINNRNLSTFETNTGTAIDLARQLSKHQVAVAASGIKNREDIDKALEAGIHNFLIGESLVRAEDPALFLRSLLSFHVA